MTAPAPSPYEQSEIDRFGIFEVEESVDLTPGVVWTDAQLDVVRQLVGRVHKAEAALRRVEAEVETWTDAAIEWYGEHRYDDAGTTYACGFEDGWNHAEECIGRALTPQAQQ